MNETCYQDRFTPFPDRIENLHFLWTVLVRAISKLSPYLKNQPFCMGSLDEDIIMVPLFSNQLGY